MSQRKAGTARLEDIPEPDIRNGSVLVEAIAVGVCRTDAVIVEGKYGWAPPGKSRLGLGHESLGCAIDPGPTSGLGKEELVVGMGERALMAKRHPDLFYHLFHSCQRAGEGWWRPVVMIARKDPVETAGPPFFPPIG